MTKLPMAQVCLMVCLFGAAAQAQVDGYLGPGVLSTGAGTIGQRSGEQLDLRFYADVLGIYDNGLVPFAVNSQDRLVSVSGLYGEQVDLGAYGQHKWKRALLGLDYRGNFYHYDNASNFDGSSQNLSLGYSYQQSRRLVFNLRALGGTSIYGFGTPGFYEGETTGGAVVAQPTALLFNDRLYYAQAGADATFLLSARTSFSAGGDGYTTRYHAASLVGVNGYTLRGTLRHRLSRTKSIGLTYQHLHFDFVKSYGQSDMNLIEAFYAASLGKRWTFYLNAGGYQAEVQGVEQVTLSPVIAALLGQSFGFRTFYSATYAPSGELRITGKLKNGLASLSYSRMLVPGNGIFLTSHQDAATASYSYTGLRKWNIGGSGGYYRLSSIGQNIQAYSTFGAGAGVTYNLTKAFHLIGRYDYRHQDLTAPGFRRDASRASIGLAFSPGEIPLSLW